MSEAVNAAAAVPIPVDHTIAMGDQTNKTPYGSLVPVNDQNSPVKPVTHGQWQFTKLNIIDKFGQALTLVDQMPNKISDPAASVKPCIRPHYAVDKVLVSTKSGPPVAEPNTVLQEPDQSESDMSKCCFVQVSPTINQNCRMNTCYVVPDGKHKGSWRAVAAEHEKPVWGWIVVNYADYGIQFFLEDGTFYREVRVASPPSSGSDGSSVSPPWAPFLPPAQYDPDRISQLDKLVQRLTDSGLDGTYGYLFAVAGMINKSIQNMPHLPSSYAGFLPGLVGKTLTLVNFGLPLELACPPLTSKSNTTGRSGEEQALETYSFKVKIGDGKRAFDGMVGYFPSKLDTNGKVDLDLTKVYTYFSTGFPSAIHTTNGTESKTTSSLTTNDPTQAIEPSVYPSITPYYTSPFRPDTLLWDPLSGTRPPTPLPATSIPDMTFQSNQHLSVFGAILDPFSPVHIYSGLLLPVATLTLPEWTVEEAMKKMTAFIRAGPVLVTRDVPIEIARGGVLGDRYTRGWRSTGPETTQASPDETPPSSVQVGGPAGQGREKWRWLQPYYTNPSASPHPSHSVQSNNILKKTSRCANGEG